MGANATPKTEATSTATTVKAFVIDATYRVEGKSAYVYLYGRQEDGKTFITRNKARAYFFIRKNDREQANIVATNAGSNVKFEKGERKDFDGNELVAVSLASPRDVPPLRDAFHDVGIQTYEADVRFAQRFLMDNDIYGSCAITGTPQHHAHAECFYSEPTFKREEWLPTNLKTLAIDIETGERGAKLYCISLVGSDGYATVLMVSEEPVASTDNERIEVFPNEKECLTAFTSRVREYNPDVITGWSVIDFDLNTLQKFCEKHKVPFILGRSDEKTSVKLDSQYFRDSTADVAGRVVLDGIALLKAGFVKLDDYKLGTAAHVILGEEKLITENGLSKVAEIERQYRSDKQALARYCRKDSELVLNILEKKQLITYTIRRSLLTGMTMDRVKASIASLDSLYLRELAARGIAARTHTYQEKQEQITGGYVMESQPGIYDYVIVCDFKSLYPSIMRTLNIDPLAFVKDKRIPASTKEYILAENGAVFTNTDGILPQILDRLHAAREDAKARKDAVAIGAIKVLMNSFFGSLASPQCRFFSLEVANAITVTGQHLIKTTVQFIKDKGYDVIYGDTDSIFIDLNVSSQEEAETIGNALQAEANTYLATYVKERYGRESRLELQFEKTFTKFFMPMTRSGESSKKRYAGLRVKDGEERMDFTGLEFVRRDWTELAKDFQLTILTKVFHNEEVVGFVKQYIADVKTGKLDEKLIYRKAIRKDLGEYTKTTPAHVKAARQLENLDSNIIEYVQTIEGPQPVTQRTAPIDYQHYIEKQLKPIADQVLLFYNTNFDDLIAGNRQKGLFEF